MGLVRLYRVTGNERYLALAKFLIDERGPNARREDQPARTRVQPGAPACRRADRAGRARRARDVHVRRHGRRGGADRRSGVRTRAGQDLGHDRRQQAVSHGRHRLDRCGRGLRQAVRTAEHDRLQRDVRVGGHGLLEPPAVPAARRRALRGRAGADALQRAPLGGGARRTHVLLSQPARVGRPAPAEPVVRRGLLPWQHHALPGVAAGLRVRTAGRHDLREPVRRGFGDHRYGQRATRAGAPADALSVGRHGHADRHARHDARLRVARAHSGLGTRGARAE